MALFCRPFSFFGRHLACQRNFRIWPRNTRRSIVTVYEEPPLDSSISERPVTVVLVQNEDLYGTASSKFWAEQLSQTIPHDSGMSFAALSLESLRNDFVYDDDFVEKNLVELKNDLLELMNPQIVLIARGPLISWISQLYLESNPLAGLVLVDPLLLDKKDDKYITSKAVQYLNDARPEAKASLSKLRTLANHTDSIRPLLLEPGSVPMMVFHSFPNPSFEHHAFLTAERHKLVAGNEEDREMPRHHPGDIPVLSIFERENGKNSRISPANLFQEYIAPWIEDRAL